MSGANAEQRQHDEAPKKWKPDFKSVVLGATLGLGAGIGFSGAYYDIIVPQQQKRLQEKEDQQRNDEDHRRRVLMHLRNEHPGISHEREELDLWEMFPVETNGERHTVYTWRNLTVYQKGLYANVFFHSLDPRERQLAERISTQSQEANDLIDVRPYYLAYQ